MMDERLNTVNALAKALRFEVIEYLVKEDRFKYNGEQLNDEDMALTVKYIDRIPCCTKRLRRLFEDAHRMHADKGMMPHCVTIGDLEWCMDNRYIGFRCEQNLKLSWMPEFSDADLVQLPSFLALDRIYRQERKAIAPVDTARFENELMEIINETAIGVCRYD